MKTGAIRGCSLTLAVLVSVCFFAASKVDAQELSAQIRDSLHLSWQVIRAERTAIIKANMDLSQEENQNFWAVYNEYRSAMDKVDSRWTDLITDYVNNYANLTLTDEKAKEMLKEFICIQRSALKTKKKYIKKFNKVLSPRKTLRLFQIENKLDAVVGIEMAKQIPLFQW